MFGASDLVSERSAWRGAEIGGKEGLVYHFTDAHLTTMHRLLEETRHLAADEVTREMFDEPGLNDFLAKVAWELADGRGAAILRGLSREKYSDEDLTRIFWGIGLHLGVPRPQNNKGDRIDHVTDVGTENNPLKRRQYGTEELIFHTDGIIGQNLALLSLCKSKSGGLSKICSGLAIHNEFVRKRPDLLELLYEGFPYDRKGKQRPDMSQISPYPVPVFSRVDGIVSVQYIRDYMLTAGETIGMPAKFREALDTFDAFANDPDMNVTFMLEPGEIEILNNRAVLHSRTQFEDYPEPERKRHLVRLWMDVPNGRPYKIEMDYLERGKQVATPKTVAA